MVFRRYGDLAVEDREEVLHGSWLFKAVLRSVCRHSHQPLGGGQDVLSVTCRQQLRALRALRCFFSDAVTLVWCFLLITAQKKGSWFIWKVYGAPFFLSVAVFCSSLKR